MAQKGPQKRSGKTGPDQLQPAESVHDPENAWRPCHSERIDAGFRRNNRYILVQKYQDQKHFSS